eukprot:gnl/Chilomastix_cuspidata/2437.p1 GENE.gnl/Chilomastix_cuspidata/2437~~gnl/Chilomastix_cuspidata/2437.p1  ORF type:complete len:447 (-),score=116.87 gnl/Chilomastix_cuspidata/2437:154-1494(-)
MVGEDPDTSQQDNESLFSIFLILLIIFSVFGSLLCIINITLVLKHLNVRKFVGAHFCVQLTFSLITNLLHLLVASFLFFRNEFLFFSEKVAQLTEDVVCLDVFVYRTVHLVNFRHSLKDAAGCSARCRRGFPFVVLFSYFGTVIPAFEIFFSPSDASICTGNMACIPFFFLSTAPTVVVECLLFASALRNIGCVRVSRSFCSQFIWFAFMVVMLALRAQYGVFWIGGRTELIIYVDFLRSLWVSLVPLTITVYDITVPSECAEVLADPRGRMYFRAFLSVSRSDNLIDFLLDLNNLSQLNGSASLCARARELYAQYADPAAERCIYLHPHQLAKLQFAVRRLSPDTSTLEDVFTAFEAMRFEVSQNLEVGAFYEFFSSSFYMRFHNEILSARATSPRFLYTELFSRCKRRAPNTHQCNASLSCSTSGPSQCYTVSKSAPSLSVSVS